MLYTLNHFFTSWVLLCICFCFLNFFPPFCFLQTRLVAVITALLKEMWWLCANGNDGASCGLLHRIPQIVSFFCILASSSWTLERPLLFILSLEYGKPWFYITKKRQSLGQLMATFHTDCVYDRRSLCLWEKASITSVIYDNIYQEAFDPPQNLSCKFRELISWAGHELYNTSKCGCICIIASFRYDYFTSLLFFSKMKHHMVSPLHL